MENEKIIILNMLKEGKINSEEALKQLESISNKDFENYKDVSTSFSHKRLKTNTINKMDDYAKIVVDKTAYLIDKITGTFFSAENTNLKNKNQNKKIFSHTFEIDITKDNNQLSLSSYNGSLNVKGHDGDKLKVKVNYEPKVGNPKIDIIKQAEKYSLTYDENMFNFISVDAFVPHSLFKAFNIECINGIVDIYSIKVENLSINNLNNNVELRNIESKNTKVEVNNGSLNAINLIVKKGNFEVSNGNTSFIDCDIKELYISTFKGPIVVNIYNFINFKEYIWHMKSFNGKISIKVPEKSYIGYDIKAQTVDDNVKLRVKKLDFSINSDTYVEGRSINYIETCKKVKINLETSNAPLIIN